MILIILFTVLSFNAHSSSISKKNLISFADKYSYKDNRKTSIKENTYYAFKDCCGPKPWTVIEGFNGKHEYKQVALMCDQCETQEMTSELKELCISTFNNLYSSLNGDRFPIDIRKVIDKKISIINSEKSNYKIKISGGSLKCDSKGGLRLRIDFFSK